MRRLASLVARLLIGLAAAAFLVGALVFLLALQLSLRAGRVQSYRRLQLAVEIVERAAELALVSRARAAEGEGREPEGRPHRTPPNTSRRDPLADVATPQQD